MDSEQEKRLRDRLNRMKYDVRSASSAEKDHVADVKSKMKRVEDGALTVHPRTFGCLNTLRSILEVNKKCMPLYQQHLGHRFGGFTELKIAVGAFKTSETLHPYDATLGHQPISIAAQEPLLFSEYLSQFKEALQSMADKWNPDFICLNELAYPNVNVEDADISLTEKTEVNKALEELNDYLTKLATERRIHVIAGSYHDQKEFFNKCHIYHWGADQSIANPYDHCKLTCAEASYEYIRTPHIRNIRQYKTPRGNFSVLICLDSYDASIVLGLIAKNVESSMSAHEKNMENFTNLVFVPSMNDNHDEAYNICQNLSFASKSIVVFTNCKCKGKDSAVFVSGTPFPYFEKIDSIEGADLRLFKLEKGDIDKEAKEAYNLYSDEFKYVLGYQPIIMTA